MNKAEILAAIEKTAKLNADYAASLRGPRTRGSTTEKGLEDLPEDYRIDKDPLFGQRLAGPGTEIWMGGNALGGQEGVMSLDQALRMGLNVKVRMGKHGPELYLDVAEADALMQDTDILTFIIATVGNPDGLEPGALVTWYPGWPTPLLDPHVAVKMHNG